MGLVFDRNPRDKNNITMLNRLVALGGPLVYYSASGMWDWDGRTWTSLQHIKDTFNMKAGYVLD